MFKMRSTAGSCAVLLRPKDWLPLIRASTLRLTPPPFSPPRLEEGFAGHVHRLRFRYNNHEGEQASASGLPPLPSRPPLSSPTSQYIHFEVVLLPISYPHCLH